MLMQLVMMSSMGMGMGMGMGAGGFGAGQEPDQWVETQGSEGWNAGGAGWSDGGTGVGGEPQDEEKPDENMVEEKSDSPVPGERSVGSTGKMQKVGDRWVFVRS
jgi:hypothetical protein